MFNFSTSWLTYVVSRIHIIHVLFCSTEGNYTIRLPGDQVFDTLVFEKAAPFTRSSSAGSTNVPSLPQGFTPGQDLFPPNRVQDLRVKVTSLNESSVVLTWTAPGDDLDTGTGKKYFFSVLYRWYHLVITYYLLTNNNNGNKDTQNIPKNKQKVSI